MSAQILQMTSADYHADDEWLNHSKFELFRKSRERYFARHEAKSIPLRKSTPALVFGNLLHTCLLEPDTFQLRTASVPSCPKRSKADKETWRKFEEGLDGRLPITRKERIQVTDMAGAVLNHEAAARLLGGTGPIERTVVWEDPATGLKCKSRTDKLAGDNLIVDVKTTDDPSPAAFVRSIIRYGYHRQAAHYAKGHYLLTSNSPAFVYIAIDKAPPYTVAVYELSEEFMELGMDQNAKTLAAFKICRESGDWTDPWSATPQILSPPPWADRDDWEVS